MAVRQAKDLSVCLSIRLEFQPEVGFVDEIPIVAYALRKRLLARDRGSCWAENVDENLRCNCDGGRDKGLTRDDPRAPRAGFAPKVSRVFR